MKPRNSALLVITVILIALVVVFCVSELWMKNRKGHEENGIRTELKLVNVFSRHGDRSPADVIPDGDPHRERFELFWPNGLAQLTDAGSLRMYRIGIELRRQYRDFLGYDTNQILAFSSSSERCVESINFTLAGLYDMSQTTEAGRSMPSSGISSGSGAADGWTRVNVDTTTISALGLDYLSGCEYRKKNPSQVRTDLMASAAIRELPGIDLLKETLRQRYNLSFDYSAEVYISTLVSEMNIIRTTETLPYTKHYLEWINLPISNNSKAKLFDLYDHMTLLAFRDSYPGEASYIQLSPLVSSLIESQAVALGRNVDNQWTSLYRGKKMVLYSSHDIILQLLLFALDVMRVDESFESLHSKWSKNHNSVGELLDGLKLSEYGLSIKFELFEQVIEDTNRKFAYIQMSLYNQPDGKYQDIYYESIPFGLACRRMFNRRYPHAKYALDSFYDKDFDLDDHYDCPYDLFLNNTANLGRDDDKLERLCSAGRVV